MHACLQTLDIQYLIFSRCEEDGSLKTLAALAQACSQFYGPAMDALWYYVDGFAPMLHSMPSHLFAVRHRPCIWSEYVHQKELYFAKEPTPEEWDIFFTHAHRIKDFTISLTEPRINGTATHCKSMLRTILKQLSTRQSSRPDLPVFPNLLALRCRWRPSFDLITDSTPRLFNPLLRAVSVTRDGPQGPDEAEAYSRFLTAMKIGYNKIESLDIYSGFSTKDVCSSKSPELSKFITNLPTLRSFYSNVLIDPAAVRHLSLSRNLTTLSCRIPELQTTHCPISTLECLRDINICAPNLDSCTSFLKAIQAPSLQSLELQCNAPCTSSTVHACLEAVSAFPRLRCLRLWADRVAYAFYQPKPCAISAHTLALLYGLRELEELHVEEHIELDLCDDDVLELARAWPAMGKLVFMACAGAGEHDGYPRLTPRALAHVAKHCPRIHQLGLPFDAAECGEALRDGLDAGDRGECLRTLDVHPPFSYVDEPREVAVFLHRLFPGLQAVRFTNTDAAVSHGWLHVAALLRAHTHADWEDHLV